MSRGTVAKVSAEPTVLEERQLIGRFVSPGSVAETRAELRQGNRAHALPPAAAPTPAASGDWVVVRALCRVRRHEDREDDILKVCEVLQLEPFDSTPLVVRQVESGGATLRFLTPIEVEPRPVHDMYALDFPPLDIMASGETRAEAEAAFLDELAWLWETYAQADATTLAEDAAELRATLPGMVQKGAS
ncbi:MAG: hypothetical protein FJX74_06225 [Armatimonadetes bacterium]|nr:hypothetical protein [Armatimonadota bacterium]